ncbi:peptidoglycan DD-metalloendopeptidase family protein [Glaciimonas soli]|uniref:Peptidoglycan DD-metalloendopeptidase family protein n=1 Tax=Glaciimonas soli TaxID=2590999 RepID=A0A843YNH6_9BURK|nr:peptidoglycan DD-metalloendopeptidase family protein [Glaciimonas soli]MQQ99333.1 peptidoglycan DD-metalloendopeptidase family protein [Glaciimonas soli]
MKIIRLATLGIVITTIAACSTTHTPAPVVERRAGGAAYNTGASTEPRAVAGPGFYTVKKGDTLFKIAQESGQSYRDIVTWNNLENANDIKVDQVLRVQPPNGSSATAGGAQLGNVTSGSGVEVKPLSTTTPSPSASSSNNNAASASSNKTGPRGDKRPYSESALAELQKPDMAAANEARPEIKPAPSTSAEKTTPPPVAAIPSGDEDKVDWMWPTDGKLTGTFDQGKKGIDIAGKAGQAVQAAAAGKVMYAGSGIRGYGNLVIIKHTNNLLSAYAHNKLILVKEGQTVSKGQKIAEMGNSDSDSTILHFEIRQQGKPVDPSKFLPPR